jgi:hypothetical protein
LARNRLSPDTPIQSLNGKVPTLDKKLVIARVRDCMNQPGEHRHAAGRRVGHALLELIKKRHKPIALSFFRTPRIADVGEHRRKARQRQ